MPSIFASKSRPSLKPSSPKAASESVYRHPSAQSVDTPVLSNPARRFTDIAIWPPERKVTSQPASSGNAAPPIVHEVLQSSGQPLDADVRADLKAHMNFDFSRVRIHTDPHAAQSARAVDAAAYTVGHHVVFDSGEFEPRSPSGKDLLNHEMMHVMQQRSALSDRALAVGDIHSPLEYEAHRLAPSLILQRQPKQALKGKQAPPPKQEAPLPTSLSDYPEAERQKITLFEALPTDIADRVAAAFDPDAARYIGETDTQTVFADNIEPKYRKQLDSLSNDLLGRAPIHLAVNQTVSFPVAPMKRLVRMTYLQHGKHKKVLLIEGLGSIQAAETKQGEANFRARKCKFGSGWSASEKQLLFQALTLIPASALNEGLKFDRADAPKIKDKDKKKKATSKKDDSSEAAVFDSDSNTVTVFDKAFVDQTPSQAKDALTHELGHGYDFRPIQEANAQFEASAKDAAAQRVMKQAHNLSGGDMDADDYTVEFRKAARKDGISADKSRTPRVNSLGVKMTLKGSETDYGNTNWKELFAESFMLFTTDPGLLQAIRPHIYAYFAKEFPPPAPASTPAPAPTPSPPTRSAPAAVKH